MSIPDLTRFPRGPGAAAAAALVSAIDAWSQDEGAVLVVGIDGRGGSGKTTIAQSVAGASSAVLVHTDDFFRQPTAEGDPDVAEYYDWQRLRRDALIPLRERRAARYERSRPWDEPGREPELAVAGDEVLVSPRHLVILEGVTAAADQLSDVVDRTVLVTVPDAVRIARLHGRIADEDWDDRWLAAEAAYFTARDRGGFDLRLSGFEDGPGASARSKAGEPTSTTSRQPSRLL